MFVNNKSFLDKKLVTTRSPKIIKEILDRFLGEKNSIMYHTAKSP